jgi:RNA polymerase sigma-70 factor (ECF subfamily)
MPIMTDDVEQFEAHRSALFAHAYRMLGDVARAEDAVQEAWVRWERRTALVDSPKAFLLKTVTHLCLDELGSARARHEESRSDRLPEPLDLSAGGLERVELLDQVSMAFLVLLQRLTAAERAVFLLHDVFEMSHAEIAQSLGKSDDACRQLLSRAREHVAVERRVLQTSRDEHRRLLMAFIHAVNDGSQEQLMNLLAEDAVLIADGGPTGGRYGRIRNVGRPVLGNRRITSLLKAFSEQPVTPRFEIRERILNGEPAVLALREGRVTAAIFVSVAAGQVRHVFLQTDPERLRHVGALS